MSTMLATNNLRTESIPSPENQSPDVTEPTMEERLLMPPVEIAIIGGGVAGSEAGTQLAKLSPIPIRITEVEYDPNRKFGGWGFQGFPCSENTNLALRKMYLGTDPQEIIRWSEDPSARTNWPSRLKDIELHPDRPFPRVLMREYVKWRRDSSDTRHGSFREINDEAMDLEIKPDGKVSIELKSGEILHADHVVLASGSISVKVPPYLNNVKDDPNVIIDPLTTDGDKRRRGIPPEARVLVLGTGLTGEEQVNILLRHGVRDLTLFSRNGMRHYAYPQEQKNSTLVLEKRPDFLFAETPEEFNEELSSFYSHYLALGHSPEDILAAIRPHWDSIRAEMGGCVKAAERLHRFRRALATNSIGLSWEVNHNIDEALRAGFLTIKSGEIKGVKAENGRLAVEFAESENGDTRTEYYDYIINAVGRNIIKHPIWNNLLKKGLAKKHAGIGVRVSEDGALIAADGTASDRLTVVGMARAGDHALRHGFLGNSAFNVPQVRSHIYRSIDAIIRRLANLRTSKAVVES